MEIILYAIASLLVSIMDWIGYILIGYIILGWLVFFGVIKSSSSVLFKIYMFLMIRIEPLLAVVRTFIPPILGLDFSAMAVFIALYLVKIIVIQIALILG